MGIGVGEMCVSLKEKGFGVYILVNDHRPASIITRIKEALGKNESLLREGHILSETVYPGQENKH
jgi:hypothetical protein